MRELTTELLTCKPSLRDDLISSVQRLSYDLVIGGIVLPQLLTPYETEELLESKGNDFSSLVVAQSLFETLAESYESKVYYYSSVGYFDHDRPWHSSSMTEDYPQLRIHVHLRGPLTFRVARAKEVTTSGYDMPDAWVTKNAYATPVSFEPNPGDGLLFVDRACLGRTGTPTIHSGHTTDPEQRLSFAGDITFY